MSKKAVFQVLKNLGVTSTESEIYFLLAGQGALKGTEIAKLLKKDKAQVYHILKRLLTKGLVEVTLEAPVRYVPVSLENVIESVIRIKKDEANQIEKNKKDLLNYWEHTSRKKLDLSTDRFVVIQGRNKVYTKISQMIATTEKQISILSTVTSWSKGNILNLYESIKDTQCKRNIDVRFLTKLTDQNLLTIESLLKKILTYNFDFCVRIPEFNINIPSGIVIRDRREALFFLSPRTVLSKDMNDESCLWTNCPDLIQAFLSVFDEMWINSVDIKTKLEEIQVTEPLTKAPVINDAEIVKGTYKKALYSAKDEVIIITSQVGLFEINKSEKLLKKWRENRIKIKILAPITGLTQDVAQKLGENFEIRHVPTDYLETVIIDDSHLFKFFNNPRGFRDIENFKNTFYSNEIERIQRSKKMVEFIWNHAQKPSINTLNVINENLYNIQEPFCNETVPKTVRKMYGSQITSYNSSEKLTEKEVIDRMIGDNGYSQDPHIIAKTFGTNCQAIVNIGEQCHLTNILFHVYHIEKHSTFGQEDVVLVHPWVETPQGFAYVFSALFTDNIKSLDFWRKVCSNSPAENNIHVLEEGKIKIRVHGNSLFAGWTVPLQLDSNNSIPPACLLVEGYGRVKTMSYTVNIPSNYKLRTEGNHKEAFVTFLYPSLKYSGPGTDGAFARDTTMEFIKP
jgi:sugar-specific transcriptional regulator TrmB